MNQEERSERSRTQILESALKLFSHRGYGATSVRDIAEDAGLSKGNVYHHFSDKETIFRALLENAASEQGARMSAMDNATRNAGDMIRKQTLIYNRTRQAQITKELIEIISGAEAL